MVDALTEAAVTLRLRAAGCVFAEAEARLLVEAAPTDARLEQLVSQRVAGLPLEHLLGWAEFLGLRVGVGPGVFVPRRRTELMARQAIRIARRRRHPVVLDLCCGASPVGVALMHAVPGLELYAADIEPEAVAWARRNLGAAAMVVEGDLFDSLPPELRGRLHLITANAPYVPTDELSTMPPEAREHEPRVTLDGGRDGLDLHRRIAAQAPQWLVPGGRLIVETSRGQAPASAELLERAGLRVRLVRSNALSATVAIGAKR